MLAKII
jgi:hypothetical protein